MGKRFFYVVAVMLFFVQFSVKAQDTFLWEISGNGTKKSSYLFGTYHILNDEYLLKYPKVLEKHKEAKVIMVESDLDSAAMLQLAMSEMMMKEEELPQLMSAADHEMVMKELKPIFMGAPEQIINKFKPSVVLMMLTLNYTTEAVPELKEYKGTPMDQFFVKKAKANGKPVLALEDPKETLNMIFNQYSLQEQADQLVKFLNRDREEILEEQRELADTYLNPNFQKMEALNKKIAAEYGDGDMKAMLDDRNKAWIPLIEKSIKENPTFIAVGAAHLPGENGVIELLRKQGYKVKPVK